MAVILTEMTMPNQSRVSRASVALDAELERRGRGSAVELTTQLRCGIGLVSRWRRGVRAPSTRYAVLLHAELGIPPEWWAMAPPARRAPRSAESRCAR